MTLSSAMAAAELGISLRGIAPVYPATQAVNYELDSMIEMEKHLLSRFHMASFYSNYISGDSSMVDNLLSGQIQNKFEARGTLCLLCVR